MLLVPAKSELLGVMDEVTEVADGGDPTTCADASGNIAFERELSKLNFK
jgi:hypothetical protein